MKKFLKQHFISLILAFLLFCSGCATAIISQMEYQVGNQTGMQTGHQIGSQAGYDKGSQDGYARGYTQGGADGYTQGHDAEMQSWQQWIEQNCFNYPFLLLDTSQYMACHR